MTHQELDELVTVGLAEGVSARSMAQQLGLERGVIDRAVKRVRKAETSTLAEAEEQADPSSIQKMIDDIDDRIRVQLSVGNDIGAQRLTKVRAGLLHQLPPPVEREDAADWSLLTDAERSALDYLVCKANGAAATPSGAWWDEAFGKIAPYVDQVHPAHLPLPQGAPEGVRLLVP